MHVRRFTPALVLFLAVVAPVLLWLNAAPRASRFTEGIITLQNIGQLAGLVGMVLFCLAIVLSARVRALEWLMGGLDRAYLDHHTIGNIAFTLLLFHPLALGLRLVPSSVRDAALFFVPATAQLPILFGIVALVVMMIVMVLTLYLRPRYNIWAQAHRFLGLAYVFAALHLLTISSDVSRNWSLRVFMLALAVAAAAAVLYRIVIRYSLVQHRRYRVVGVRAVGSRMAEVTLAPIGLPLRHEAGQFVFVRFKGSYSAEEHPFTVASAPGEPDLRLVIKDLGDWTKLVDQLVVGTVAEVDGPYGTFVPSRAAGSQQVWVAGGIGITPFLSAVRERANRPGQVSARLYYCVRTKDEAAYLEELQQLPAVSSITVVPWISGEQGYLTGATIREQLGSLDSAEVFICGPERMMEALALQLMALGVLPGRIHREAFGLP